MHLVSHSNDFKSIELLINEGAKVYKRNIEGKTPKDTSKGNIAIFKYLLRLEKNYKLMSINKEKIRKLAYSMNISQETTRDSPNYSKYQCIYNLHQAEKYKELNHIAVSEKGGQK